VGETDKDIIDGNWVADFETTTDENDCRVWLWGLCNVGDIDEWSYGISIASFMHVISQHNKQHVYFHNLAFDGAFILDWLLLNGFTHYQGRTTKRLTFSTLISRMAKFYSITVVFANGTKVEFRDSLKKLPMSVANVAKAFKLDEGKGELDYYLPRPVGYIPTDEELDYLRRDVQIIARALRIQFIAGMKRLTVGADSLYEYKTTVGVKTFTRTFPILCTTMDEDVRRAYRGGFAIVAERFKGVRVGQGRVYDVNSLYPSVMYDRPLPYGNPRWFNGPPQVDVLYPLFVVCLTLTAKLKPDHVPCIQIKGSPHFAATVYQSDITEPTTLTCTNIDLALWRDHYDIDVLSWEGGWKFHAVTGFFTEYIDKWMNVKEHSDGGLRFIAKLHLNSLYGKFATNPDVTPRVPVMDNENIVRLVVGESETRDPVYTPVGVFITAYARDVTIRAAQQHYDVFAYADTDSLHLLVDRDPDTLDIHPTRLGAWKSEGCFTDAIFVRAKCYSERMIDGTHSTHVAGLPESIASRVTLDDMTDGAVWSGKLSPHRVPGGIVLRSVNFTLNM